MLLAEDFDTWNLIFESVAGVPQEMISLTDDLKAGLTSILETGSLPDPVQSRTKEFLSSVSKSGICPLLELHRITQADVPIVEDLLMFVCETGVKALARKRSELIDSAFLILKADHSLYRCREAEGMLVRIISQIQTMDILQNLKDMTYLPEDGTIALYAALILGTVCNGSDLVDLFRKTGSAVALSLALDPRSIDTKLLEVYLNAYETEVNKDGNDALVTDYLDLLRSILNVDVMEKRYKALAKLSALVKHDKTREKAGEWFVSHGISGVTDIAFRDEFSGFLGDVYEFLSEKHLIPLETVSKLWEGQKYLHISDVPSFFNVFEKICANVPEDEQEEYLKIVTCPTEKHPEWVDFLGCFAKRLKKQNENSSALLKLKDILLEYVVDDASPKAQQSARKHIQDIIHCGLKPEDARALVNRLLDSPLSDFEISLIHKLSESMEFMDDDLKSRITAVLSTIDLTIKSLGAMIVSLVKKQSYSLDDEFTKRLLEGSETRDVVMELVKGDILGEAFIEQLLQLRTIGESQVDVIKYFISHRVDTSDGLKELPFVGESLLWEITSRESSVHESLCRYFVNIITNNNQEYVSSQVMIKHFLTRWEELFTTKPEARTQLISLLKIFVTMIDEDRVQVELASERTGLLQSWIVIGDGISRAIRLKLATRTKVIAIMARIAKETGMSLGSFALKHHGVVLNYNEYLESGRSFLDFAGFGLDDQGRQLFVSAVPENERTRVPAPQTISPSMIIGRTNIITLLYEAASDGSQAAADIVRTLPLDLTTTTLIQLLPSLTRVDWQKILPFDSSHRFARTLLALTKIKEREKLPELGILEYLASVATKSTQTIVVMECLVALNLFLQDKFAKEHADRLLDDLLRIAIAYAKEDTVEIAVRACIVLRKIADFVTLEEDTEQLISLFEKQSFQEKSEEAEKDTATQDKDVDEFLDSFFERMGKATTESNTGTTQKNTVCSSVEQVFDGKKCSRSILFYTFLDIVLLSNCSKIGDEAKRTVSNIRVPVKYKLAVMANLTSENATRVLDAFQSKITQEDKGMFDALVENSKPDSKILNFTIPMLLTLCQKKVLDADKVNSLCKYLWTSYLTLDKDVPTENVPITEILELMAYADHEIVMSFVKYLNEHQTPIEAYGLTADSYNQTGISGLVNLGNTCYLNSTLQQFFHIPSLRGMAISYRGTDEFLTELRSLFTKLRECNGAVQTTRPLCDKWINWDGRKLDTSEQQDACEFIQMLIDKLIPLGCSDITRMFHGKMKMTMKGLSEEYHHEYEEPFTTLAINVKGLSFMSESLEQLHAPDFFTGRDQYFADSLKKRIDASRTAYISSLPDHLIIQLKRFEYQVGSGVRNKISSVFDFPQTLDMKEHCIEGVEDTVFELTGIVVHSGSAMGGHYFSFIQKNGNWYECNDKKVTQVKFDDLYQTASGRAQNIRSAFVLFYSRKSLNEQDTSVVDEPLMRQIHTEREIAKQSHIFCGAGLFKFYEQISKDGTQEVKEMALRYILRTLSHTSLTDRLPVLLNNLLDMKNIETVCAESTWLDVLLDCPDPDFRAKLAVFLEKMNPTDAVFERCFALVPKAIELFRDTESFWRVLKLFTKDQLKRLIPQLKVYLKEKLYLALKEKREISMDFGAGPVIKILGEAEVEPEFWCSESVLETVIHGVLFNWDASKVYSDHLDFAKTYINKTSLNLPFIATGAFLYGVMGMEFMEYMRTLRWIHNKKPVTPSDFILITRHMVRSSVSVAIRRDIDGWLKPHLFSRDFEVRKLAYTTAAALCPHVEIKNGVPYFDSNLKFWSNFDDEPELAGDANNLVEKLFEWLPEATEYLIAEMPDVPQDKTLDLDTFPLTTMLFLVRNSCAAVKYAGSIDNLYPFMRALKTHSQPYDPHISLSFMIIGERDCPEDILLHFIQPLTKDSEERFFTRAKKCFNVMVPKLVKLPTIPDDKIAIFLKSFTFMVPDLVSSMKDIIWTFTNHLIENYKDTVLSIIDQNLDEFLTNNISAVATVLEKCGEKRHLINHLSDSKLVASDVKENNLTIETVVQVNEGPLESPESFVSLIQRNGLEKKTRDLIWQVITDNKVDPNLIAKLPTNYGCITRKARYILDNANLVPNATELLLVYSCNSEKALYECCSFLDEHAHDEFTSREYAKAVLTDWWEPKTRVDDVCVDWRKNKPASRRCELFGIRRYVTFLPSSFPKEEIARLLAWLSPVMRSTLAALDFVMSSDPSNRDVVLKWEDRAKEIREIVGQLAPYFDTH